MMTVFNNAHAGGEGGTVCYYESEIEILRSLLENAVDEEARVMIRNPYRGGKTLERVAC